MPSVTLARAAIARFLSLAKEERAVGVAWAANSGTVGGLVAMNAGTPADAWPTICWPRKSPLRTGWRWVAAKDLHFSYGHCELPRRARS